MRATLTRKTLGWAVGLAIIVVASASGAVAGGDAGAVTLGSHAGLHHGSTVPTSAFDTSAVAEWARDNGLTGLSPASLHHVPTVPRGVFDTSAVANWASDNGLSGLSPASLHG